MWISSYCVACIYQQILQQDFFHFLQIKGNSSALKHISGVNKVVEAIHNIIQNKKQCQTIEYDIQFICCSYKNC